MNIDIEQLAEMLISKKEERKFAKSILIAQRGQITVEFLKQLQDRMNEKLPYEKQYQFTKSQWLVESMIRLKEKHI